ncbi:MAG: tetratricopeptide (TPR) repeat protein [Akkermansiaceae bacterium]|jgi:tetratricopeptide (TPR) repeat protein
MKKLKALMAVGLSLTCAGLAQETKNKDLNAAAWYQKGMAALKMGKPDDAKVAFQNVLKLKPGYTPAKYQLARIPELNARAKLAQRKALFKSTRIPKIDFNDATLEEALEALNVLATQATEKKFSPNFVIQDPTGTIKERKVTLKMKNIPLSAALTYLLNGAGAQARFDEHATVIRPIAK